MWNSLLDGMGWLLAQFYRFIPSYGVAIILLTVTVRLLLYPLTAKQARSMAAMQRLQPEIKRIQEKYKHDRQKLNEELMAFYREHKVNPLSGCLPLLAQLPIFFALFQVLRRPATHIPTSTALFRAFCPGVSSAARCDEPRGLHFLGMDLSQAASSAHDGVLEALPFFVLLGLVIATGYWQSRQMRQLQQGPVNPQAQLMSRLMPPLFGLISYSLPAGLVLYFLTSNLWQIGQQQVVFGKMTEPGPAAKGVARGGEGATERPERRARAAAGPPDGDRPARGARQAATVGDGAGAAGNDGPAGPLAGSSQKENPSRARGKARKRKKRKRR